MFISIFRHKIPYYASCIPSAYALVKLNIPSSQPGAEVLQIPPNGALRANQILMSLCFINGFPRMKVGVSLLFNQWIFVTRKFTMQRYNRTRINTGSILLYYNYCT